MLENDGKFITGQEINFVDASCVSLFPVFFLT